jgi:ABC-type antimicrobial peptide transport system permease subunit
MERHLGVVSLPARLSALVITAFALLALGLAAIGVYGLMSYSVARRRREVGIRMALGAGQGSIVRTLVAGGLRLVVIGAGAGLLLALLLTRPLSQLLFGVGTLDVVAFVGAPLVLVAVAVLAAAVPAWRASRVHPASTLRAE